MDWKVLCGFETGIGHRQHDEPCQDSVEAVAKPGNAILAVADGAGGRAYSHSAEAAKIATTVAIWYLRLRLSHVAVLESLHLHRLAGEMCTAIRNELRSAALSKGEDMRRFASTLSVACVFEDVAFFAYIGDSPIVVEYFDGKLELVSQARPEGQAANETCFVSEHSFVQNLKTVRIAESIRSVAIFSDGLEVAAIQRGTKPHQPFFETLFEWAAIEDDAEKKRHLQELLSREDLLRLSCDDMSIALATRRRPSNEV